MRDHPSQPASAPAAPPALLLDETDRVRDCNPAAAALVERGAPLPPGWGPVVPPAAARLAPHPTHAQVRLPGWTAPVELWWSPSPDGLWCTLSRLPDDPNTAKSGTATTEPAAPGLVDTLFRQAPVLLAQLDERGCFSRVNPHWQPQLGWSPEALRGRPVIELVHPAEREATRQAALAQLLLPAGADRPSLVCRLRRGDGDWAWLSWTFWRDPATNRITAVALDQTEERLDAETRALRAAVVERTSNAVIVTDADQRITWVNPGFTALSGYSLEEARGHVPAELLVGPETDRETVARIQHHLDQGRPVKTDVLNYTKDGSSYWARLDVQPLTDRAGQLIGHMAIETDLSEARAAQAELEEARRQAEAHAAEAERANTAKSRFLATMSHELRTPLNQVLGAAQLLGRTALDREQQALLSTLGNAGKCLLALLNDLLDFAELDEDELMLHRTRVDPREIATSTVDHLSAEAERSGLHLALDLAPNLPARLEMDELRFRQLLLNLMRSGLQNTDTGGVSLALRWDAAQGLRVLVADTGTGQPGGAWQLIGEASRQASHLDAQELGLFVALRIVRSMGGSVGSETTPGIGTTVWADLPVGVDTAPAARPAPLALAAQPAEGLPVLLVEDNPVNRKVACHMLRAVGCAVDCAEDGEQALRALESRAYCMVFMDCHMPVMDGWEATRRLRERERARGSGRVPVVAVTASSMRAEVNRCFAVGMDEVMTKPVSLQHYADCLKRWTDRRVRTA